MVNYVEQDRQDAFYELDEFVKNTRLYFNLQNLVLDETNHALSTELVRLQYNCFPKTKKLYRYRPCSDYALQALRTGEIWLSNPSTFNDPFDGTCYVDKDVVSKRIFKELGIPNPPKYIDRLEETKKYTNVISQMGRNRKVACFSEDIESTLMWAHYANSGKGFALEYDVSELYFEVLEKYKMQLTPVIYQKERPDVTLDAINWFKSSMFPDKKQPVDGLLLLRQAMYKTENWAYEREWRLVDIPNTLSDLDDHAKLPVSLKPKKVYLGYSMSEADKKKVLQICGQQGYPVHEIHIGEGIESRLVINQLLASYKGGDDE